MPAVESPLRALLGDDNVASGEQIPADYAHDECIAATPVLPDLVVKPSSTEQVSRILALASEHGVAVTPRGAATGLSGGCIAAQGGIVLSLERMNRILEIDEVNHVAVVQPAVTLAELDEATAPHGLIYPIFPGENSASLGGNVATNAGGMRAVKYGVTRHQVLGLEAVLASGEIIRTGGKFVKVSSGYDLTQLLIGSEGTLAVITEVTVKLFPRLEERATLLAPFASLEAITRAVPALVGTGLAPLMVEYIDQLTMLGIIGYTGLELGVSQAVQDKTQAYLVIAVEGRTPAGVQADVEALGERCAELGALDVFVLSAAAGRQLIEAREKSHWVAKSAGARDVIDIVVPRGAITTFTAAVQKISAEHGTFIPGCGHAGDGNIHMAVFEPDPAKRSAIMTALFEAALALGGAVSAEHGIGTVKKKYFNALESPTKLALMRGIKQVFDPKGILSPATLLE